MNNNEEKVLREKMDRLDTLAGGIVYGKEEAWDKLQARMDRKPAKRVLLRYWMAAAAVLLLMITIMVGYNRQDNDVAGNMKTETTKPIEVARITPTAPMQAQKQPGIIVGNQDLRMKVSNAKGYNKTNVQAAPGIPEQVVEPATVVNENLEAFMAANKHLPEVSTAQPMKVVHINDLEHGSAEQTNTTIVANTPVYVLSKLPVVHINEVEREAQDVKQILRENRMTYRHIPFLKSAYDEYLSPADDNREPINFFKLKFTTQN